MSIFDTIAAQTAARPQTTAAGGKAPRLDRFGNVLPDAEFWLNIGLDLPVYDPETGEEKIEFVSLPIGLPLDTMSEMEVRGKNKRWNTIVAAKNQILQVLVSSARETLEPGGTMRPDQLIVEIRRREDPNVGVETTAESEKTSAAVLQMLGSGKVSS